MSSPDWTPSLEAPEADGGASGGEGIPESTSGSFPARANEALLTFEDREEFERFLKEASRLGLQVVGSLPRFQTVRVRAARPGDLLNAINRLGDGVSSEENLLVGYPGFPRSEASATGLEQAFEDDFLRALGVEEWDPTWGKGVVVAVLDSGVEPHLTLGDSLRAGYDLLENPSGGNGHGTAVASVMAGSHPMAPGVAPGVTLDSYRVLDESGVGDMFTLAEGIVQAVDNGAQIINLSLGSYGESAVVDLALDYAAARQVAVVAAVGNDGAPVVAYPARHDSVIAVGSIDARLQQAWFSNSGAELDLVAPGYGLHAAYPDNKLVAISGTSLSGPIVAGVIAGVMSDQPGWTATEAARQVMAFSRDAGLAGKDPDYGAGLPDVRRLRRAGEVGVEDVGVTGIVGRSGPQGLSLHTAVQNQGTQTLFNIQLEVKVGTQKTYHPVARLDPGESYGFNWDLPLVPEGTALNVVASARSSTGDDYPENNEMGVTLAVGDDE